MSKIKRILITILCLVGLGLSIELCVVYFNANFVENAAPSICAINDAVDCDSVAKTTYSQFWGIPLSLWGVFLYLFILFMTFVDKLKNLSLLGFLKVFKNQTSYIFCVSLLAFCLSMILGTISIVKINSICVFCFLTYLVDLLIALTSKNWGKGIFYELKNSINDFIEAIKVKAYALAFLSVVLVFICCIDYFILSNVLTPQVKQVQEMKQYFKNYEKLADKNILGPEDADVVIKEYIDFNCGGCFLVNLYIHRIIDEFENVKVIQYNLPLEKVCNPNMLYEGHKNSCLKASYALAAENQNKYWEMSDVLFSKSPNSEKEIIEQARLLDFDIKKLKTDANGEEVKNKISELIGNADAESIEGTPTLIIGVKHYVGVTNFEDFKKIIIENGGKQKQINE